MRVITALLVFLGLAASGRFALAQTSAAAPANPAANTEQAAEPPRAPAFEYLGRLRAKTGTRTVVENGPQQGTRTIVQLVRGRFEGPRVKATLKTPARDWITNRTDGSYRLDVRLTLKTDDGALILVTCPNFSIISYTRR
jgi:hypothetical protein